MAVAVAAPLGFLDEKGDGGNGSAGSDHWAAKLAGHFPFATSVARQLQGSTVRLFSATFRVPIAVTGNCIRD